MAKKKGRPFGKSDFLEEDELKAILAQPDRRSRQGLRDYAVLLLLANTGMRKGELVRLKAGNVVDQGGSRFIHYECLKKRAKKLAVNQIPITQEVYEAVQRYLRQESKTGAPNLDMSLFWTSGLHGPHQKAPLTPKAVDLIVKRAVKGAGVEKRITPHSFRATFATRTLAGGADLATVKELLGHSHIGSTEPYLRTNLLRKQRAIEAVSVA